MANELKVSKELIEVIAGELKTIGTSHLHLAEQLFALAGTAPSVDEVVKSEVKDTAKKAPAKEVEETEEAETVVIEFEGKEVDIESLTVVKLKKLAKENEIDISELGSKPKKADLIALILEALEGEEDEDENEDADDVNEDDSAEEEEEDDAEESEEEDEDAEDDEEGVALEDMTVAELKDYITEDLELDVPAKKKTEKVSAYKERLIEFIEENMPEDEEEGDVEDSETTISYEDEDEEEVKVDLAELSLKEIKALAKEFNLKITAKKKDAAVEQFLEQWDDAEDEDGEEEEEDIAEQYGLNDMSVEELAEILEEAELSTKGKKQALISRIVEAVENGDIEFEEGE